MKSMTGYGKANFTDEQYDLEIEVRSVNNKVLQLNISTYKELFYLDNQIKDIVSGYIKRGKVDVRVNTSNKALPEITIDEDKVKAYFDMLNRLKEMLSLKEEIRLETILKQDNVLAIKNPSYDNEHFQKAFFDTLSKALEQHQAMATAEGEALKVFFLQSVQTIEDALATIEATIPAYKEKLKENLTSNVKQIWERDIDTDVEKRILVEVAMYLERANITEEIVRLRSHISNMKKYLANEDDEIGKSINFILQEMHREVNTISAKYNTSATFHEVLKMKEEVEKCKEQIQNVE